MFSAHRMLFAKTAAATEPLAVTYASNANDGTDLTTYTFSSQAIGTASATRKVYVGISARQSGATLSVASLTVAGVPASEVTTKQHAASGAVGFASIWAASVASGSTGDIVVTLSGAAVRCGIVVWAVTGASITPYSTANYGGTGTPNLNLNTLAGYSVIALTSGTPSTTTTWTGVTEDADFTVESTMYISAGSANSVAAATPRTITPTPAGGASPQRYGVAICIAPA